MKKFVSILVSLALVFSFASIGLFATQPGPTTSVTYDIAPTYIVVIPPTVTAGSNLTIGASGVNIEPNKQVLVRIGSGITGQSAVKLIRQDISGNPETELGNGSNVLSAPVTLGAGFVANNTTIASFRGISTENHILDTLYIGMPDTTGKLAGTYAGALTFDISYVDLYA